MEKSRPGRHRFVAVFVVLLCLGCLATLYSISLLKKGIYLDRFSVSTLSVEKLSLIWIDKLSLDVGRLTIDEHPENNTGDIPQYVELFVGNVLRSQFLMQFFSDINIHSIELGDLAGRLELIQDAAKDRYSLQLLSNEIALQTNLSFLADQLSVDITELTIKPLDTEVKGKLIFDSRLEQITGKVSANISSYLPLSLEITANSGNITFKNSNTARVESIKPIVDLFEIDPDVQPWITTYLSGSHYLLETLEGVLPWSDPAAILENLIAKITVENCEYTFAPGLEPIKTGYTDVEFRNGSLKITPHDSTFYGQSIHEGQVDIDFNDPANIVLTTHIVTKASLNDDILKLLNYYDISLPFKQTKDKTATDLLLKINLSEPHVTSKGEFQLDEGEIIWDNEKYAISRAKIISNNSEFEIVSLRVQYENLFTADIAGIIDVEKGLGELQIEVEQFDLKVGKSILRLGSSPSRPSLHLHLHPDGDSVDVSATRWDLDGMDLTVAPFKSPFVTETLSLLLPETAVSIDEGIKADISGNVSIKALSVDLSCNLKQYDVNDVVMVNPGGPIAIRYDQGLTLENKMTSQWKINGIATTVYPSKFKYTGQLFSITDSRIRYGDFFDSKIAGHYNRSSQDGLILLEDLVVKDRHVGHLIGATKTIPVEVSKNNNKLLFNVPELDLKITSGENKQWSATFYDLATIYPRSEVLQQYKIEKGRLTVSSQNGKRPYDIRAEVPYRYPVLIKDNKPIHQLHIVGEVTDQGFSAIVNDQVKLQYKDDLTITSDTIGYNIPAIIQFFREQPSSTESDHGSRTNNNGTIGEGEKKLHISLEATDSYLFFKADRKALADHITLEYDGSRSEIELLHKQGNINLEIEGDQFTLTGEGLGDTFMGALIQGSEFDKGTMTLAAKGSFTESSALIKIENSTLKSLNPLNNILAFLDTIPALITFSLPDYSTKGLYLNSAVLGLKIQDNIANVEHLAVQSPVLSMTGVGWIDIPRNMINMDLNLITMAKTNISKIPLLGYILTGKEKRPSITLQVSGDLQNPDVKNTVFRDVATLPFSLLYRTLTLPVRMVNSVIGRTADDEEVTTETKEATKVKKDSKE